MFPTRCRRLSDGSEFARLGADIQWLHRLAPGFRAIHPVDAELPQECVALMSHAFLSDQFDIMYRIPGLRGVAGGAGSPSGLRMAPADPAAPSG